MTQNGIPILHQRSTPMTETTKMRFTMGNSSTLVIVFQITQHIQKK